MDVKSVQIILPLAGSEGKIQRIDKALGAFGKFTHSDVDYFIIDSVNFFNTAPERVKGKRIILCSLFGKRMGVIVDAIVEFLSLDALFIQKNIDFNVYDANKYISWHLDYQGRKILYPNYEKIAKELSSSGFFLSVLNT